MTPPRRWMCVPALARPLQILGVEQKWFLLSATAAVALFQILKTLTEPALAFAALYAAGRWTAKADPRLLQVLAQARRCRARYDPGKPPRAAAR